jgi:hypothetical protein
MLIKNNQYLAPNSFNLIPLKSSQQNRLNARRFFKLVCNSADKGSFLGKYYYVIV